MIETTDSRSMPTEAQPSRTLKGRHLQLMGMGAAIGAGFFLSSGSAIHEAGPGLLLAYLLAGTVMYLIMRALGELALAYPSAGSFTTYATKFLGPLAGFIMGWSYWLGALLVGIAEITAIGILLRPWFPGIPQWVPALGAVVLLYAVNIQTVRSFGEAEYWMSMIKVATLFGVLLCVRSLACSGQAPLRLQSLSRQGIPHFSVSVSGIAMLIGVGLNYAMPERLFGYLLTMVAWLILLVWANITLTHLLYRRGVSRGQSKRVSFRMPGAPYTSWLVLLAIGFVAVMLTIHESSLITLYLGFSWFGLLIVAYLVKAWWQSKRKGWD